MELKDYYAILEISRLSSPDEIRSAYRTLSKRWHPDLNHGKDVTQKMQDINEAYAILKDPAKKTRYDSECDTHFKAKSAEPKRRRLRCLERDKRLLDWNHYNGCHLHVSDHLQQLKVQ